MTCLFSFTRWSRAVVAAALTLALVAPLLSEVPAGAVPATSPSAVWQTNGVVWAVERVGNKVILGGEFTKLVAPDGRTVDRVNLAALDATTGSPLGWRADTNGPVLALEAKGDGSVVYVGGDFRQIKGVARTRLAAVRASDANVTSLAHAAAGRVRGLHVRSGRLYVAGEFDALGGVSRARVGAIDLNSGAVVGSFAPMVQGGSVRDIDTSPDGNRLYLAGTFTSVGAAPGTAYAAAVKTADGAAVAWNTGVDQPLFDVLAAGGEVYLAVGGTGWDNNRLQQHSASTGNELTRYVADGDIQELELHGDVLYVGGHFVELFGGVPRKQLAAIDVRDGKVLGFNPNIETRYGVWDIAVGLEGLWIAGEFTRVGGVNRRGIALLPGNTSGAGNDEALVQRSHWWKFFDRGSAPGTGTTWTTPGYGDGTWATARPELGFGAAAVNRTTARVDTLYARRTFQVANPADFSALEIRHLADDGAAIYLNGTEVVRDNLPGGALSYGTRASTSRFSERDTYLYRKSDVAASRLRVGTNVIAVEIHNASATSDDLRFGLELLGRRQAGGPAPAITPPASCSTSVSGQNVTVSWSSVGAAASYIAFRNPDNTSDFRAGQATAPATSFVDSGVRSDATFTYKVVAVAADGARSAKRTCSPTVRTGDGGGPAIQPPASCSVAVDGDALRISWSGAAGADKYYVYRRTNGAAAVWAGKSDAPTTQFRDTNVTAGPSFAYRVASVDARGTKSERRECTPVSIRIDGPPPVAINAPASCAATVSGANVTVSYSAVNGADRYTVFRNPDGVADYWAGTPNSTSFVDSNVRSGPTFTYKVIAIDAAGNRSSKRTCSPSVTISPAPPPPAVIAAPASCSTTLANDDITVNWSGVGGADKYYVYRSVGGAADVWASKVVPPATSFVDTNRAPGTYTHRVVAVDPTGRKSAKTTCAPSRTVGAQDPPPAVVAAPPTCSASIDGATVAVSWTAAVGVDRYTVYRNVEGTSDKWLATEKSRSVVDTNPATGQSAIYKVVGVALNGAKSSKTQCGGGLVVNNPAPAAPTTPPACSVAAEGSNVAITWSSSSNHNGYEIFRYLNGGSERSVSVRGAGETSFVHVNPPKDVTLTYTVRATGGGGTTSAKRTCSGTATISSDPCVALRVELFRDTNYGASLGRFGVGSHVLILSAQDQTSSIKVPLGLRLEAYDFVDFTGYLGFTTSNVSALVGGNDDIEAIRVVCEL